MSDQRIRWTQAHQPVSKRDNVRLIRNLGMDDLDMHYQPIVELGNGQIFAAEALVRCNDLALRHPPHLFERAVEQGACGRLGRLIRQVIFEQLSELPVFINIHPHELSSRWLVRPDDPICFYDYPVFLEITESAAFEYFDLCRDVLNEVQQRTGAHVVVDDFGAGYSNLHRIVELSPSFVKLDRSLVANLHEYPRKRILIQHLVALCEALGAHVIAEGIEKVDELKALRDLGVHYGQGYLLARPGPPMPSITWPQELSPIETAVIDVPVR